MSLHQLSELRDRTEVFEDRDHAGRTVAGMLEAYRDSEALVLGIPTRGLPIAASVAATLGLPLDVAVVSKITFPWNPETGYGAVAFDGTVKLHRGLIADMGLIEPEISKGSRITQQKVDCLAELLRGDRPFPDLRGRTILLVDEGVASSITMETAVAALMRAEAGKVIVAVATGYETSLQRLTEEVAEVYCANVRGGWGYDVTKSYRRWSDVSETEAERIVARFAH